MTVIDVDRHGTVAISDDPAHAAYPIARWERVARPAAEPGVRSHAHAVVEVLRRFGGHAPRAVLGGEFTAHPGTETVIEVGLAGRGMFDTDDAPRCSSLLGEMTLVAGLPAELAAELATAVRGHSAALPAGTLRVHRAAYDLINSSEAIFAQAAAALVTVLSARVYGQEVHDPTRQLVSTW
ncbi:hypothetical protein [Amycolatopsis magusensis]|uniref:Uncharacterized protein n=1 Tax=Amycolatopsis magusensis TaxID=882444 RepID=A0ABS4PWK6_9PSEU|nr:hypothetical protein [Amycolatopsis magusensis]MBP2183816.1 hypothetical protein [Amycolatopsis magusensis]